MSEKPAEYYVQKSLKEQMIQRSSPSLEAAKRWLYRKPEKSWDEPVEWEPPDSQPPSYAKWRKDPRRLKTPLESMCDHVLVVQAMLEHLALLTPPESEHLYPADWVLELDRWTWGLHNVVHQYRLQRDALREKALQEMQPPRQED